jgi:uncharacterized damage-inducible protein DinB
MNWAKELSTQLEWYWTNQFRPRLIGLTDAEYLWEPVEGCWNIRPVGNGKYLADYQTPEPDPPPVTTIAWRLSHIAGAILAWCNASQFGGSNFEVAAFECPGTAEAALRLLDSGYARWRAGVESLEDEALARTVGPAQGCLASFAGYPLAALVLHLNREVIHHGAEVALLRDLYRASGAAR